MEKTLPTQVTTSDGLALHLRRWPSPLKSHAQGTVLIVHGLGEHIGRYGHVAAFLNDRGWHVVGYDQRGHGHSGGKPGRVAHSDSMLHDLSAVIDSVRAGQAGPLVLLGHSVGGLVASRFVAEGLASSPAPWHRPVDALVLSSPALALPMSGFQKLLLTVLGAIAPDIPVSNCLKPAWLSHDAAVVAAYQADPRVHDRLSPRLLRFLLDGGQHVRQLAGRWTTPTLLVFAGADRCVDPAGSREFVAAAPGSALASREFAPLFHEIFNEPQQAEVLTTLGEWLAAWRANQRAA